MVLKIKNVLLYSIVGLVSMMFTGCGGISETTEVNAPVDTDITTVAETTPLVVTTEPVQNPVVNITVEGDNLIHSSIYNQASARAEGDDYDFTYAYENVEKLFTGDLNIMNQETLICNDEFEPADYPQFNSPVALGDHMVDIGINIFSICNNHTLDMGTDGLKACLDYWERKKQEQGIISYGAYYNEEDLYDIRTTEVNGITFSFVAFTQYTNGLSLPEDSPLQIVYTSEEEKMRNLVQKADELSDVVIVSVHWGQEDVHEVDEERRELAQKFADWGANLIIGTHSHTVQSMEYVTNKYGDQAFVFYSLGNFISAQSDNFNMIGLVGDLNVTKDLHSGSIIIDDVKAKPVITHYDNNYSNVRVYPYSEYNEELASSHGIHNVNSGNYHDFSMEVIDNIITENVPEEFLYLK